MAQVIDLLKEYNFINMTDTDKNGYSVLHLTVMNKKITQKEVIEDLKILLDNGADPKIENKKNETVLQLAVKNRMKDIVDFLLTNTSKNDLAAHFFVKDEYEKFSKFSCCAKLDSEIRRVERETASFVEWLLTRGFDFDCKNERKQSALFLAIELNLQHILPVLLKCTKVIDSVDRINRSILSFFLESKANNYGINKNWYSMRYETEIVKILLDKGVSVDTKDHFKRTSIQLAIENEVDLEIIEMLLEQSTNVNKKNYEGNTLLHVVLKKWINSDEGKTNYYLKITQILLAKGADLNVPDKDGKLSLVYAIEKRNLHVIEFLNENGADFNVTMEDGRPLIYMVFTSIYMNTCSETEMAIFELLLSHTTNIHHKNAEGDTLFHSLIWKWACSPDTENEYYMKIAGALIDKGADINEPNEYGTRPLLHAIGKHNLCIVEFLRDKDADFDVTSGNDETLLHFFFKNIDAATFSDHETKIKLFEVLLERSKNVHLENSEGDTLFFVVLRKWATSGDNVDYCKKMAQALISKIRVGTNDPDIYHGKFLPFEEIGKHSFDIIEFLEETGADFNMRTIDGETLLHLFVKSNSTDIKWIGFLIGKGCQLNARDNIGSTPLHVAAMHSNVHVIKSLIKHGARVNSRNQQLETPLHFAIRNRKVQVVAELLLKEGANVHARDIKGQTPLHKLAFESRTDHSTAGLKKLLEYGADVNARDSKGITALNCARLRDFLDWVRKCRAWREEENESRLQRSVNDPRGEPPAPVRHCRIQYMASDVVMCLTKHSIRLKAANLPWDEKINSRLGHFIRVNGTKELCEQHYNNCVKEVDILKSTFIDSRTTLYDFFHMGLNRRRGYVNNEKLNKLIRTPIKLKRYMFPNYADLIFISYNEALARKKLLEPARKAWRELTNISLPEECIEYILSFLDNSDLYGMLGI